MSVDQGMAAIQAALLGVPQIPNADDAIALRQLVIAWASKKKRAGWRPEDVILEMKACAAQVGLCPPPSPSSIPTPPDARVELLIDLVLWCIQGYFRQEDQPPRSA